MTHHITEVRAFRDNKALKDAAREDLRARMLKYLRQPATAKEVAMRFGQNASTMLVWLSEWVEAGVLEASGPPRGRTFRALRPGETATPAPETYVEDLPRCRGTMHMLSTQKVVRGHVVHVQCECGHRGPLRIDDWRNKSADAVCVKCSLARDKRRRVITPRAVLAPFPRGR